MKQTRKVMATVYFVKVVMRWKIFLAPMMALTMALSPGLVSTMSAAPLAASVAPAYRCMRADQTEKGNNRYTSCSSPSSDNGENHVGAAKARCINKGN